jgi:hypothetical protein
MWVLRQQKGPQVWKPTRRWVELVVAILAEVTGYKWDHSVVSSPRGIRSWLWSGHLSFSQVWHGLHNCEQSWWLVPYGTKSWGLCYQQCTADAVLWVAFMSACSAEPDLLHRCFFSSNLETSISLFMHQNTTYPTFSDPTARANPSPLRTSVVPLAIWHVLSFCTCLPTTITFYAFQRQGLPSFFLSFLPSFLPSLLHNSQVLFKKYLC